MSRPDWAASVVTNQDGIANTGRSSAMRPARMPRVCGPAGRRCGSGPGTAWGFGCMCRLARGSGPGGRVFRGVPEGEVVSFGPLSGGWGERGPKETARGRAAGGALSGTFSRRPRSQEARTRAASASSPPQVRATGVVDGCSGVASQPRSAPSRVTVTAAQPAGRSSVQPPSVPVTRSAPSVGLKAPMMRTPPGPERLSTRALPCAVVQRGPPAAGSAAAKAATKAATAPSAGSPAGSVSSRGPSAASG